VTNDPAADEPDPTSTEDAGASRPEAATPRTRPRWNDWFGSQSMGRWTVISGVAALLTLALTIPALLKDLGAPDGRPTRTSNSSTDAQPRPSGDVDVVRLTVDGLRDLPASKIQAGDATGSPTSVPSTLIDLTLLNRGPVAAVFTEVGVVVKDHVPVTCRSAGEGVDVSVTYDLTLNDTFVGSTTNRQVAYTVDPGKADRFDLSIGTDDEEPPAVFDLEVYANAVDGGRLILGRVVVVLPVFAITLYDEWEQWGKPDASCVRAATTRIGSLVARPDAVVEQRVRDLLPAMNAALIEAGG
jgi:hypothetical protein